MTYTPPTPEQLAEQDRRVWRYLAINNRLKAISESLYEQLVNNETLVSGAGPVTVEVLIDGQIVANETLRFDGG